ncbi:MAG: TetR/AcrR family transcriptional regulator, partial [Alphaproteobacteria bacterium]
ERRATAPLERLLAVFDVLGEWCGMAGFRGCPFINAAAEYGEPESPIRQACAEHNRIFYTYMRDLAAAAGVAEAEELARQLVSLFQGAIVIAYVNGEADAAKLAGNAARILLENKLAQPAAEPAAAASG